jgi:hypothetical protein
MVLDSAALHRGYLAAFHKDIQQLLKTIEKQIERLDTQFLGCAEPAKRINRERCGS